LGRGRTRWEEEEEEALCSIQVYLHARAVPVSCVHSIRVLVDRFWVPPVIPIVYRYVP
jgi:hypothetical protein